MTLSKRSSATSVFIALLQVYSEVMVIPNISIFSPVDSVNGRSPIKLVATMILQRL